MSGYGTPPGPPSTPRSRRSGPALPVLELVGLGLAVLAFIVAFLPWAGPEISDELTASGWDLALPTAATVLLLVAGVLVAAPLLTGSAADADGDGSADRAASPVPALLAILAAVLFIVHTFTGGTLLGGDVERKIGVWLGLIVGLGAAAVLTLSWLQRSGRMRKPAPATPTGGPWSQQQPPQGWGQQQPGYGQQQPPAGYPGATPGYGQQQPGYGQQPGAYGQPQGPATGGQPAQPGAYGQEQQPYPGGQQPGQGYPSQGGYPQG